MKSFYFFIGILNFYTSLILTSNNFRNMEFMLFGTYARNLALTP